MENVPDPRWKTDGDYAAKLSAIYNGYDNFTDMEDEEYDGLEDPRPARDYQHRERIVNQ